MRYLEQSNSSRQKVWDGEKGLDIDGRWLHNTMNVLNATEPHKSNGWVLCYRYIKLNVITIKIICHLFSSFLSKRKDCCCLVSKSWLTLWNPVDCSLPGSSVHGVSQARMLEWTAVSYSRGSSWPRNGTCISCTGGYILYHWATWEVQKKECFHMHKKGRKKKRRIKEWKGERKGRRGMILD